MTSCLTIGYANISNKYSESISGREILHNGRRVTYISNRSSSSSFSLMNVMKVALLVFSVFTVTTAQNWDCPTPQGSYLDSCDRPVGKAYRSTDPILADVKLCSYALSCNTVKGGGRNRRTSLKVLPREDLACAKNWENCNGFLIGREDGKSLCQDSASIKRQLIEHGLFNPRDEL